MNIKKLLSAAAAAALLAACSDYDPGLSNQVTDLTAEQEAVLNQYAENFVARYGEIDPDHTWGFGSVGTRAITVDKNENILRDETDLTIPGWPMVTDNSKYSGLYMATESGNDWTLKTADQLTSSDIPAGDVTDEEIEYVSRWFRDHRLSDGGTVPYTKFFIQNISTDVDLDAYPTWVVNGNDSSEVGTPGTVKYPLDNNGYSRESISWDIDYLDMSEDNSTYTHVNDFNSGATSHQPLDKGTNPTFSFREMTYIECDSYPVDFAYHNSDDNNTYTHHWALRHLVFDINGKHYDGYYLGFDYEFNMDGGNIAKERDYHFNNWIIKISPATSDDTPTPTPGDDPVVYTHRIFCEDLGSTYDFDFNDVVFDAYVKDGNTYVKILASGGTLPIYVGPNSAAECTDAYEAHHILNPAVELNANGLYAPILHGTATRVYEVTGVDNVADVKIWVDGNLMANVNDTEHPTIVQLPSQVGAYGGNGNLSGQAAGTRGGQPPYKLCVPVGTKWPNERVQIETVYPYFRNWVQNENSEYNYGGTSDWTKNIGDASKLVGE